VPTALFARWLLSKGLLAISVLISLAVWSAVAPSSMPLNLSVISCSANKSWFVFVSKSASVRTLPSTKSTFLALILVSLWNLIATPLPGSLPLVNVICVALVNV
jgi:hypothetical protein